MNRYHEKLNELAVEIDNYFNITFNTQEEDFETNKIIKTQIEYFIKNIFKDNKINRTEKNELIDKALLLLASKTGCAEDLEIAEEIVDRLIDEQFISPKQSYLFYENSVTKRWE